MEGSAPSSSSSSSMQRPTRCYWDADGSHAQSRTPIANGGGTRLPQARRLSKVSKRRSLCTFALILAFAGASLATAAASESPSSSASLHERTINPSDDNIFLHLTPQQAHCYIIALIYTTFWLGALGWEIFSTIPFDGRLIKETNWKSAFSICNSAAYLISRYFTFGWIVRNVEDILATSDNCTERLKTSATFYSIAVCSTYLIFALRTINVWNMKLLVAIPLLSINATMIILCAVLSSGIKADYIPGSRYCQFEVGMPLAYAILASCAAFDLANFVVLSIKISKNGWKEILRSLLPQTKANYDSDDVSLMLLHRTGLYTLVQFLILMTLVVIYCVTTEAKYQVMQISAFHAISTSMCGRIFRKAWRLTRAEASSPHMALPPEYSSRWARNADDQGTSGMGGIDGQPSAQAKKRFSIGDASYVEGELSLSSKDKRSPILPKSRPRRSRVSHMNFTDSRMTGRSEGEATAVGDPEEIRLDTNYHCSIPRDGAHVTLPHSPQWSQSGVSQSANSHAANASTDDDRNSSLKSAGRKAKALGLGLNFANRSQRAWTSAGPSSHGGDASTSDLQEASQQPRRPRTADVSGPVQIISPHNDREYSRRGPNDPLTATAWRLPWNASEAGSAGPLAMQSATVTAGVSPRTSSAAQTSGAIKSVAQAVVLPDGGPSRSHAAFVTTPALSANTRASAGLSPNSVVDLAAARAAANIADRPTPNSSRRQSSPLSRLRSTNPALAHVHPSSRPNTSPEQEKRAGAVRGQLRRQQSHDNYYDPRGAFLNTVEADSGEGSRPVTGSHSHVDDRSNSGCGSVDTVTPLDGRPRTSRGGPVPAFGRRGSNPSLGRPGTEGAGTPSRQSPPSTALATIDSLDGRPSTSHGGSQPPPFGFNSGSVSAAVAAAASRGANRSRLGTPVTSTRTPERGSPARATATGRMRNRTAEESFLDEDDESSQLSHTQEADVIPPQHNDDLSEEGNRGPVSSIRDSEPKEDLDSTALESEDVEYTGGSAIDATYRKLEKMARARSVSSTASVETTSASISTSGR